MPMKKRREFLAAARSKRRWTTPGLVVQARLRAPGESVEPPEAIRFGLTASRKVGGAVVRNRARRRLRALARLVLPRHGPTGCDIVLIARAVTATRPHAILLGELETALRRLKLWRP